MIPDNLTQDAPALQNPDQNSAAVANDPFGAHVDTPEEKLS